LRIISFGLVFALSIAQIPIVSIQGMSRDSYYHTQGYGDSYHHSQGYASFGLGVAIASTIISGAGSVPFSSSSSMPLELVSVLIRDTQVSPQFGGPAMEPISARRWFAHRDIRHPLALGSRLRYPCPHASLRCHCLYLARNPYVPLYF
jgi:hypothetical protein